MRLAQKIYQLTKNMQDSIVEYLRILVARKQLAKFNQPYRLHVGCGSIKFKDWINLDIENKQKITDIVWNAARGFPFIESQSCLLIYCEHFLEHLTIEEAQVYLSESYRILQPGGTLRIAMPSLEYIINKYRSENWRDQDWLKWNDFKFIQTRAEMMNISFRWWGHQWLYDKEELHRRLQESGFNFIQDMQIKESNIQELQNRETREDSFLIVEAKKLV
jgi:predicted SAM-dependent methyltransferase